MRAKCLGLLVLTFDSALTSDLCVVQCLLPISPPFIVVDETFVVDLTGRS
jgi:hypothetical protein